MRSRLQPVQVMEPRPGNASAAMEGASSATLAGASAETVPTGWRLNDVSPRYRKQLSNSAGKRADLFMKYLRQGFSPGDAASKLGPGTQLKPLKSSPGQFEIRLNHTMTG
jgi:hypothetical protein